MTIINFLGTRHIQKLHWVADFEERGKHFCMDENSLSIRIENLKRQGIDTSEELKALAELHRRSHDISV